MNIHDAHVAMSNYVRDQTVKSYSHGRSAAPGHEFFVTVNLPRQNNITVHGGCLDAVMIDAVRKVSDVNADVATQTPAPPTTQLLPPMFTRAPSF